MARNQINLNRYRKIYPQLRKSPVWWTKDSSRNKEAKKIDIGNGDSLTFTTTVAITQPIVVATSEENINVWVSAISANGNFWDITISHSDAGFTGVIHVHIAEGAAV